MKANKIWKIKPGLMFLVLVLSLFISTLFSACGRGPAQITSPSITADATASEISTTFPSDTVLLENIPTDCPVTFVDEETEGPFYKDGSPERTDLVEMGIPGDPLSLSGYVLDKNCNPVAGAWIDFWQADGNGNYDNTGYKLRGHQLTDSEGRYVLQTVMPGEYPGRTNHIHVKLRPGENSGDIVTTQLYFPGAVLNSSDGIFNSSMLVTFGADDNDRKIAYFNFKLEWD